MSWAIATSVLGESEDEDEQGSGPGADVEEGFPVRQRGGGKDPPRERGEGLEPGRRAQIGTRRIRPSAASADSISSRVTPRMNSTASR